MEQGQRWAWVACALITRNRWMTRGPKPLGLSSRLNRGNVTLARKLPSITKTPTYPTSMCPRPLNSGSQRCWTGLARCPDPPGHPSIHGPCLTDCSQESPWPRRCRGGRGFGRWTFTPRGLQTPLCACTFPGYSGSKDRGLRGSLLSPD